MALYVSVPKLYDLDYDGSCRPGEVGHYYNNTFSVGIFQWIPKTSGEGLKRSAVIYRIRGFSAEAKAVYDKAEAWIEKRQEEYRKNPRVR